MIVFLWIYFLIFRSGFVWYAPCHWWIMEFNIFKAKTSPNTCHGHYWAHECQNSRWSPGWCNVQKLSPFRTSRIQVCTYIMFYLKFQFFLQGSNVSTTPLRQWDFRQCLLFSWTTLRGKHGRHPIAVMGVVDTFGLCALPLIANCIDRRNKILYA